MSRDKQTEIQQFAIDLQNVSAKVSNIIMEETHEFLSRNHKYNSLKDFHEAHKKGRNVMEAEFLVELGYAKASWVAEEIFAEIEEIRLRQIRKSEFFRNGSTEEMERKFYEGAEWGLRQLSHWFAELKKKYTQEK